MFLEKFPNLDTKHTNISNIFFINFHQTLTKPNEIEKNPPSSLPKISPSTTTKPPSQHCPNRLQIALHLDHPVVHAVVVAHTYDLLAPSRTLRVRHAEVVRPADHEPIIVKQLTPLAHDLPVDERLVLLGVQRRQVQLADAVLDGAAEGEKV